MRIDFHGQSGLVLISDSLPPGLRQRWHGRVTLLSDEEWKARDPRAAGSGFYLSARQAGDFVILNYHYSERLQAPPDSAPRHYAGGGSITLLRTATGWKEVSRGGWVT
jgi:hypothetical protein